MTDLNKVILIGRLTKDSELSYAKSGTAILKSSIAVNQSVKRGEQRESEVSYFDFTLFGKSAENLKPYLTKGKQICVEGSLKQERWTDQNGNNHSKVSVIAESVQLLGSKSESQNANSSNGSSFKPNANQQVYDNENNFSEDLRW